MPRPLLPTLLLAAATSAGTSAAAAQGATPVPAELARAILLMATGDYGRSQNDSLPAVLVGRVPEGFPRELLPAQGALLGAVRLARSTWVIQRRADDDTASTSVLPAAATSAGWHAAPMWPEARGGFVPAESSAPSIFCRGDTSAMLRETARPGGGRYMFVTLQHGRGTVCRERSGGVTTTSTSSTSSSTISSGGSVAFVERPNFLAQVPIPTLRAPAGAQSNAFGSSSSGGGDHWSTETRLSVRMSADDLVAHYGRQLVAQGWTLLTDQRLGGATLATLGAEKRDDRGATWRALLTAQRLTGAERYEVMLRLVRGDAQ